MTLKDKHLSGQSSTQQETHHPWVNHAATYRSKEVEELAKWIITRANGSLIGLSGTGKSDLLGFLCHRPEVLHSHLPLSARSVTILPMDLNTLPAPTLSALFRSILRTFYEHQNRFAPESQGVISRIYHENRAYRDAFLPQSGLRELLLHLRQQRHQVVFALDRFDAFSTMLTPKMGDSLRGLRDSFKETVSYIACMTHSLAYLPNPEAIGDLKRLLDQQICVIGPLSEADTRDTIVHRTSFADFSLTEEEITELWRLTGGYPSLVMQTCRWWLTTSNRPPVEEWQEVLMRQVNVRHRLEDIWSGLTQEEQSMLIEMQKMIGVSRSLQEELAERQRSTIVNLREKGLILYEEGYYKLFSTLFSNYVANVDGRSRGRISLDRATRTLYHGNERIDQLTPKERSVLQFLAQEPYTQHSYTDIIVAAWSDDESYEGVTNDSLFQVVRTLRQKIEPVASKPVYVVNWRGKPEGGYQFFPEGKPQ